MPFKSKAQQRFMFAAEERGDVPKGIAEEWAHKTKNIKKLPEHKKKASEIAQEALQKIAKEPGPPRPPDFSDDKELKEYWKTRVEEIRNQMHNQSRRDIGESIRNSSVFEPMSLERKLRLGLLGATVLGGGAYLGYKALHKLQEVPKEASEIAGAVMRKVSTKGKTAALLARRVICKVATITNEDVQGALATGKPARNIEDDEINEMASEWRARGKEEAKNRPWWGAGIGGTLGGVLGALAGSSHSIRPRSGVGGLAGGLIGLGLGGAAGLGLGALSRHSHAVGNQNEARFLGDTAQSGLPYDLTEEDFDRLSPYAKGVWGDSPTEMTQDEYNRVKAQLAKAIMYRNLLDTGVVGGVSALSALVPREGDAEDEGSPRARRLLGTAAGTALNTAMDYADSRSEAHSVANTLQDLRARGYGALASRLQNRVLRAPLED